MNGTAQTTATLARPTLRRTPVRALTALSIGAAAALIAAPAAHSQAEEIPFDLHGTVDGGDVTVEWDDIAEAEEFIFTVSMAGTDGVFIEETFTTSPASFNVADIPVEGYELSDYVDYLLAVNVSGQFPGEDTYYAYEQAYFSVMQDEQGEWTIGAPDAEADSNWTGMTQEEMDAHFEAHFTVIGDDSGEPEPEGPSIEDFSAEQENSIFLYTEGGPAARGVEALVTLNTETSYLNEELDLYLLPQQGSTSETVALGTDLVEEHYTVNIHQENVQVDHTAQIRLDESLAPGQYWLVAYTSSGEPVGWHNLEIGEDDFSDVEEYQGDQKTRTPEELHESLSALAETGEGQQLLEILCADPAYGYLCDDQGGEPGPSESPNLTEDPTEAASPSALPSETPEAEPASHTQRLADTGFGVLILGLVAAGLLTTGIFLALRSRDNGHNA
ncbi:DUF1206 domain-containing protein [Nesterenkonia ebinurensis]|uniref:DUF1206 domain-containing protein n=1 Tax=Nesterenkonia ebinurensis TaxID=2608252 RepID=UPI00123DD2E3|nr:DUF1206 domain-containing protein [Nesterenkonia ebinurensis]